MTLKTHPLLEDPTVHLAGERRELHAIVGARDENRIRDVLSTNTLARATGDHDHIGEIELVLCVVGVEDASASRRVSKSKA